MLDRRCFYPQKSHKLLILGGMLQLRMLRKYEQNIDSYWESLVFEVFFGLVVAVFLLGKCLGHDCRRESGLRLDVFRSCSREG